MSPSKKYVLPKPPEVGPQPPLMLAGSNLGLGYPHSEVEIFAVSPGYRYDLTLEQALRHIDLFVEPDRTRILWTLPYQFDIPGETP